MASTSTSTPSLAAGHATQAPTPSDPPQDQQTSTGDDSPTQAASTSSPSLTAGHTTQPPTTNDPLQDQQITSHDDPNPRAPPAQESDPANNQEDGPPSAQGPQAPGRTMRILRIFWATTWLPLVSFTYLAVCYVAQYRTIELRLWKLDNPVEHLTIVKAGVTTVSILTITVSLLPVHWLISDLRSEEFFRILSLRKKGVPLLSVNNISIPSFGLLDTLIALLHRQCSSIFVGAILVAFVAVAGTALGSATLSVRVAEINGDIMAFRAGAIFRNTVWNSTTEGVYLTKVSDGRLAVAGSIPWIELTVGGKYYGRSPTSEAQYSYIVPTVLDVPIHIRVRYLTDVVRIQPVCQWLKADGPWVFLNDTFSSIRLNFSSAGQNGLSFSMSATYLDKDFRHVIRVLNSDPGPFSNEIVDMKGDPPSDGTVLFQVAECRSGCEEYRYDEYNPVPEARMNLSNLPKHELLLENRDNSTTAWDVAFLSCWPNAVVETREVETDDKGGVTVKDLRDGRRRPKQGNLDLAQTKALLGQVLAKLGKSGPDIGHLGNTYVLGGAGQVALIFGKEVANPQLQGRYFTEAEAVMAPLPITNITTNYGKAINGAMKAFLDGSLAVTYVPGRTYDPILMLTSSLPHLIVSTFVFGLLTIFLIACHFRTPAPQFTFFHIATALSKSTVPSVLENAKLSGENDGSIPDHVALNRVGNRLLGITEATSGSNTIVMHE